MQVHFDRTQRQAARIGIVFTVRGQARLQQIRGPWLQWQPAFDIFADVGELGVARRISNKA